MINTTELRIGNLVSKDGEILPVCSIHSDSTIRLKKNGESIGCFSVIAVNPIPLTSENLGKAGFVKDAIDELEGYSKHGRLSIFLEPVQCSDGSIEWYTHIQFNIGMPHNHLVTSPPQYLHQLQNLYFALTGDELNIQL